MRNWISDKFGRNRGGGHAVRTTRTTPTPQQVVPDPTEWVVSHGAGTITYSSRGLVGRMPQYYGTTYSYITYDEMITPGPMLPTHPAHVRLPDGI